MYKNAILSGAIALTLSVLLMVASPVDSADSTFDVEYADDVLTMSGSSGCAQALVEWMISNSGGTMVSEGYFHTSSESFTETVAISLVDETYSVEAWINPTGTPAAVVHLTAQLVVKESDVPVTGITLSQTEMVLTVGGTGTILASVSPSDATNREVIWSSGDESVATVDQNGIVTAVGAGTTTVKAVSVDGEHSASCNIIVYPDETSFDASYNDGELTISGSSGCAQALVEWMISDSEGTMVSEGYFHTSSESFAETVAISLVDGTYSVEAWINPTGTPAAVVHLTAQLVVGNPAIPVESVTLSHGNITLGPGSTAVITATVSPDDATNKRVTWTSDDDDIAVVDQDGKVTAVSAGTARITATSVDGSNIAAHCTVTVMPTNIPVTDVTLSQNILELTIGERRTLTATILPTDATNTAVTWSSSDTRVATVSSGGSVYAVGAGDATITVTTADGGHEATCIVNVVQEVDTTPSLNHDSITMTGYGQTQLSVSGMDASDITWSTDNALVATVDQNGLVTTTSAGGSCTVTAAFGDQELECRVTVVFGTLSANPSDVTVSEGASTQISVSGWSSAMTSPSIRISVGNTAVATASASGSTITVTGQSTGTTSITVNVSSLYRIVIPITVEERPITTSEYSFFIQMKYDYNLVSSATLAAAGLTTSDLRSGFTITATGTNAAEALQNACDEYNIPLVLYSGGDLRGWVSSMFGLGDVYLGDGDWKYWVQYHDGQYNDMTLGYYTDGGSFSLIYDITAMMGEVTSVTVSPSTLQLNVGGSSTLSAAVLPENAVYSSVTWSSSNPGVATVDQNGRVTAVSAGTATITATSTDGSNVSGTCAVTVVAADVRVTGVSLSQTSMQLSPGTSQSLVATVRPDNATNTGVTWSSGDADVATVDQNGRVTAISAGTATITVTTVDGEFTASCTVTVSEDVTMVPVTGVSLSRNSMELTVGASGSLTATVSPDDATNTGVTWSSSDPSVATVGTDGTVTAVAVGTATITVTTVDGEYTATCSVTVSPVRVTGVTLSQSSIELGPGSTSTISATVSPDNATDKSVTWASSDEDVATVDQSGNVTAVSAGTATITVTTTDGGHTASCTVTVSEDVIAVTGVTISQNSMELTVGASGSLTATLSPDDATNTGVTWSSSDLGVATVNSDGTVTAVAVGTATITVTTVDGGFTATCSVTVSPIPVAGVTLSQSSIDMRPGTTTTISATVSPDDATDKSVTWTSSDGSIATVDQSGNVTAVSAGTVTITATTVDGEFTATCSVRVLKSVETIVDVDETDDDGSTVTGTTTRVDYEDGSSVETGQLTVTDSDGNVTEIVSEKNTEADGSTDETVTETTTVGTSTIEVVTNTKTSDGETVESSSTTVTIEDADNGVTTVATSETSEGAVTTSATTQVSVTSEGGAATVTEEQVRAVGVHLDAVTGRVPDATPVVSVDTGESTSVTIATIEPLARSGAELTVSSATGTVSLDRDVVGTVSQSGSVTTLSLVKVPTEELNGRQQERVGESPVFEVQIHVDGTRVHQLGGTATLTVPHELGEGQDPEHLHVWFIDDDGNIEVMDSSYDADSGVMTFTTVHFSKYAIVYDDGSAEPAPEEEDGGTAIYVAVIAVVVAGIVIGIATHARRS